MGKIYTGVAKTEKVLSENSLYKPRNSKKGAVLYKPPEVEKYQSHIVEQLNKTSIANLKGKEVSELELFLTFYILSRFWTRDLSNMVKIVEDAIVKVTEIDDAYHTQILSQKKPSTKDHEFIIVTIKVIE